MKKTPLRRVSKKRARKNRKYTEVRRSFLEENPICQICLERYAEDIHHKEGRDGERLVNVENFMAVCRKCHRGIHENPAWAKTQGYRT